MGFRVFKQCLRFFKKSVALLSLRCFSLRLSYLPEHEIHHAAEMIITHQLSYFLRPLAVAFRVVQAILRQTQISQSCKVKQQHAWVVLKRGYGERFHIIIGRLMIFAHLKANATEQVMYASLFASCSSFFVQFERHFTVAVRSFKIPGEPTGITQSVIDIWQILVLRIMLAQP